MYILGPVFIEHHISLNCALGSEFALAFATGIHSKNNSEKKFHPYHGTRIQQTTAMIALMSE